MKTRRVATGGAVILGIGVLAGLLFDFDGPGLGGRGDNAGDGPEETVGVSDPQISPTVPEPRDVPETNGEDQPGDQEGGVLQIVVGKENYFIKPPDGAVRVPVTLKEIFERAKKTERDERGVRVAVTLDRDSIPPMEMALEQQLLAAGLTQREIEGLDEDALVLENETP